jgi:hypothetical protein
MHVFLLDRLPFIISPFLYRQVLTLMVPSRLEFISSGDWAMISDWQTVGLCWCFALIAFFL